MSVQKPQGSLTVVLLPSGDRGKQSLDVARSWAAEGLLKRALWIPAEKVQASPFGGAQAVGVLLDQGQEAALDALTVLSRSRLRTLTLVILQISEPQALVDETQLAATSLLVQALKGARPEALVQEADDPVQVLMVNLLTGPTGLAGVPYEKVTSRAYNANLVASPEDRRAADQMDRFVRPEDNLVNWAMAQCATVGGLWSGMPQGPWEIMRSRTEDSSLSQSEFIQPLRGFARIVTSAPTARRALATAMSELRFLTKNALIANHLPPVNDWQPHLERVVAAFDIVDGGRIRYETPGSTPEPGKSQSGFFSAVGGFLQFSGREIAQLPLFVFRREKARLGARTTSALSGEEGHMEVYVGGQAPDIDEFMVSFERQSIEAQYALGNMTGGVPPAAPELWRTLRATAFGLLDGSDIPEPVPTPIVADQRVVMPLTTLVVPPPIAWAPSSEELNELAAEAGFEGLFVPSVSPWRAGWMRDLIDEAWQREQEQLQQATDEREAALAVRRAYQAQVAAQLAGQSEWATSDEVEGLSVGESEYGQADDEQFDDDADGAFDDVLADDDAADEGGDDVEVDVETMAEDADAGRLCEKCEEPLLASAKFCAECGAGVPDSASDAQATAPSETAGDQSPVDDGAGDEGTAAQPLNLKAAEPWRAQIAEQWGSQQAPAQAQPATEQATAVWADDAEVNPYGEAPIAPPTVDIEALDERIEELRERAAGLQREQASLEQWIHDRENSLLWRLTSLLQARTVQASADAAYFRELATSIPQIDPEEPRRARNKFANRFLLMLSLGALLAWLVVRFGDRIAEFLSVDSWVPWAVYGVIMFVWLLILLISYYRRRSRFLATLRRLRHQQRDAIRQCREASYAEQRLRGLYEQMVDWGEILGYVVHDPWQPKESWFTGLPDADLAASLPTCVDLAVPDPNDKVGFRRLKREAMLSLAGEGWRARAFNVLLERMLAEQDIENSTDSASQLDMDSPATPNGSLRTMLEMLRSDQLQPAAAEQVMRSKAASLYAERATLASHALIPINSEYAAEDTDLLEAGSDLELMRPEWGDFLAGVLSGRTQFSVNLWSDEGMTQTANRQRMDTLAFAPPRMMQEVNQAGVEVIATRAADVNRGVELSARCDFGPPVERHQVRFFAPGSQRRSGFEPTVDHAFNGGAVGAGEPYVGPAPTGGPVSGGGRAPDPDIGVFN